MENANRQDNRTPDSYSPAMGQRITAQVQRVSQVDVVTNNLEAGVSPVMFTGLAAVLAQMQSQEQVPMLSQLLPPFQVTRGLCPLAMAYGLDMILPTISMTTAHRFHMDHLTTEWSKVKVCKCQILLYLLSRNNNPRNQLHGNLVLRVSLSPRVQVRALLHPCCLTYHSHHPPSKPCQQHQLCGKEYMQLMMQRHPTLSNLLLPQKQSLVTPSPSQQRLDQPSTYALPQDQPSTSAFQPAPTDQPSASTSAPTHLPSVVVAPPTSSSSSGEEAQPSQRDMDLDESRSSSRKPNDHSTSSCSQTSQTSTGQKTKSQSSKPPPGKKSTARTTTKAAPVSKLNKLKSVVSGASVLPPPPLPPPLPPPPNPIGYTGKPEMQLTVEKTLKKYPTDHIKIVNSGPTGTPLRKQSILSQGGTTRNKMARYLPASTDTQGSLVDPRCLTNLGNC